MDNKYNMQKLKFSPQRIILFYVVLCVFFMIFNPCESQPKCPPALKKCIACGNFSGQGWYVNCTMFPKFTEVPELPVGTWILDLSWNRISRISREAFATLTILEGLFISANQLSQDTIDKDSFANNAKLITMDLSLNKFTRFPRNLPKYISRLYFVANEVDTLFPDDLQSYVNISFLQMSKNKFTSIPTGFFQYPGKDKLKVLQMSSLPIGNAGFPSDLDQLINLEQLELHSNMMTEIPKNLPASLKELDLFNNSIVSLTHQQLRNLPNLLRLRLGYNKVSYIEQGAFSDLANLDSLSIEGNRLISVEPLMFEGLSNLVTLDIGGGPLQEIKPKTFASLERLKDLQIFRQMLLSVDATAFEGLSNLEYLYMGYGNITHIAPNTFASLTSLQSLSISDNKLSSLDASVLPLNLLPNLTFWDVTDNPWYCDCKLRWLMWDVIMPHSPVALPSLIKCAGPARLAGITWDQLTPEDFVCEDKEDENNIKLDISKRRN